MEGIRKKCTDAGILELIDKEMKYWKIPGTAISVVRTGEVPFISAFGVKNKNGEPVDSSTIFCIASCTKAMTAALIARLVTGGILDFDTPVSEYLKDFSLADSEASEKLTLRDIMCHKSGLGGHDGIWPSAESHEEFIYKLRYLNPSAPFRSVSQYSNVIYSLAGYVAEQMTGISYDELMKKYLFEPLGMTNTTVRAKDLETSQNHAMPFKVINGECRQLKIWDVDTVAPAASVSTNAIDMGKWLEFLISGGLASDGTRLIDESVFEEMISKQTDFDDFVPSSAFYPTDGYAFGWQTGAYKGHRICKHTGKIEGYSSLQVFLPEKKIAVAVLMNLHSPSIAFFHTVLYTLLDVLLGESPENWASAFHGEEEPAEEEYTDCSINLFRQRYPDACETKCIEDPDKYAGKYYNPGYGNIDIIVEDGGLSAIYHGTKHPLRSFYGGLFCAYEIREDILTYDFPVAFLIRDYLVEGLQIPLEPTVADIVFWKEK